MSIAFPRRFLYEQLARIFMIAFLRGKVAEALPQKLTLDVHGVGYEVHIPLSSFDHLNPKEGDEVKLLTILHIRENAHTLYGFATEPERDVFRLLVDRVSGIGPATALSVLSGINVEQFKSSVVSGDSLALSKAKGVGKKTAERIILELKDKVGLAATWQAQAQGVTTAVASDAELALIALGFKQVDARKAITKILEEQPEAQVDDLIRAALRRMG